MARFIQTQTNFQLFLIFENKVCKIWKSDFFFVYL